MDRCANACCERQRRIELGKIIATPGALRTLRESGVDASHLLQRHESGDWGDLSPEDFIQNEKALAQGMSVLSVYTLPTGARVWVITAWNRRLTTLLLPSEY
jgi:hypothetical protein